MPEFLTLVMIESSSNKLRIRPSESIKPEPLDERILDTTEIVNWSTFRCGLSHLKSRITWPRGEVSDLVLTNTPHRILLICKFQIRSYLSLEQRKKNPKKQQNNKTPTLLCLWNLYFWIVLSLLPYLPRKRCKDFLSPCKGRDPAPALVFSSHLENAPEHFTNSLLHVGSSYNHMQLAPLVCVGRWQWIQYIKSLLEIHI